MKRSLLLYFIFFLVLTESSTLGQEINLEKKNPKSYLALTVGAIEVCSFSIGYFLIPELSLTAKVSVYAGELGNMSALLGIGIGGNYHFNTIILFNYLSADYIKIYEAQYKGHAAECTLGFNSNTERGLGFIYELGVGYSDVMTYSVLKKYQRKYLFGPVIKIGLNYNFW